MRRNKPGDACCKREVEVRDDRVELEHRRHQRIVHLGRVEVQQADARETGSRQGVEPAQQRRERAGSRRCRGRTTRGPAPRGRARSRLVRRARALRPRSIPASVSVACHGTTGSHRTRRRGRTPRRSSRTPTARDGAGRGSSRRSRTPVGLLLQDDARRAALTREADDRVRFGQRGLRARRRSARPCNR